MTTTLYAFAVGQGLLGARVFGHMLAGAAGDPIVATPEAPPEAGSVVAIVPVLDEAERIGPCLEGLLAQPPALESILVVEGGSRAATRDVVRAFAARDARVRLVDATPVPPTWNGKVWNLSCGLAASDPTAAWILTIDADVRPHPSMVASLLAHAATSYLDAFSAAPLLALSGPAEEAIHPAFLATLVYRFGMPGNVVQDAARVQANGQVFLAKRALLVESAAFSAARASRSDDVTIARRLVRCGAQVGFFEGGALASVGMYASATACWNNWPRSLPMRDADTPLATLALQLAEVAFVQALPLAAVLCVLACRGDRRSLFFRTNLALALARFGVLAGTRRAYARTGPAYWSSILFDVPAALRLVQAAFAREA
ncbi:MAG: glycosyltransferase, partial [Candidatus Eremiobacteraeota bacterium]|nr:glycosyltransferase [Candidatus Eremiobacteraeota bacterium]